MIKSINIKKFRAFENLSLQIKNFNILLGNNQTGKISILEAINFAILPYFLAG